MKKISLFFLFYLLFSLGSCIWADNTTIIYFDAFSSTPKPASMKTLEALKAKIAGNPDVRIVVEGYTDAREIKQGDRTPGSYPLELSRMRASYVSNWLSSPIGRPLTFDIKTLGNSHPVGDSNTPQGSAVNRRVEVKLYPKSSAVSAQTSGNSPKVFVPEMSCTFSPVFENTVITHNFIVKNKGNAPLSITDVKPG
ncbi:MAG: OmpA family protein [Desulfobacteraceae bacterium]|nr:OmpA family protein [Desulfobacteraceae bacterium]